MRNSSTRISSVVAAVTPQAESGLSGLSQVLGGRSVRVVFQPVVSLITGDIHGYEVLGRCSGSDAPGPAELLEVADRLGQLRRLDDAWKEAALEIIATHHARDTLSFFLNIDPGVIDEPGFDVEALRALAEPHQLAPGRFVLELTERGHALSSSRLQRIVQRWSSQGFRIALDDVGAGYSSLKALLKLRPHLLKLDMDLVRGLDEDALRFNLVRSLAAFALGSGLQLIAEGVETEPELMALQRAGITLGQGWLLGRPADTPVDTSAQLKGLVRERASNVERMRFSTQRNPVRSIMIEHPAARPDERGEELEKRFREQPAVTGFPVVDERGAVCGLVMRDRFFAATAGAYGYSLHALRPVSALMDVFPLRTEADVALEQVSRLATARASGSIYDLILVEDAGKFAGVVTVQALLAATTDLQLRHAKYASPLTGLPGNVAIEHRINEGLQFLETGQDAWLVYVDLDHFKPYNDVYGFTAGDEVIKLLASLLDDAFCRGGFQDAFLGHVGGDDFVVVVLGEGPVEAACDRVARSFDDRIRQHYAPGDFAQRKISGIDRQGKAVEFPILTVSMALLGREHLQRATVRDAGRMAAQLKVRAKTLTAQSGQSGWAVERRVKPPPPDARS